MTEPLVEIFIPTYDRAEFIGDAIESALNQDYPNVRVTVVDNCSTDNTADVVARYAALPNFEYYVNERNIGLVPNFNECNRRRTDGYFTILGSDDALLPNFASDMLRAFEENPDADVVGAKYCLASNNVRNITFRPETVSDRARRLSAEEIIEDTVLSLAAFLIRPGFDMRQDERMTWGPDQLLFRHWAVSGARVYFLSKPVSIYCQHDRQATQLTNTLTQYSESMFAHIWAAKESPDHYSSTLLGRLDHCAYMRSQKVDRPNTAAVLGIVERLIRARYILSALHVRGLGTVFGAAWAEVTTASQALAQLAQAMNRTLASAPDVYATVALPALQNSIALPEDAPGAVRRGHRTLLTDDANSVVVNDAISTIYRAALQAEQLLPVAEAIDNVIARQQSDLSPA